MAVARYITLLAGALSEVAAAITSAGATSSGQVVALNASGLVDNTMLPARSTVALAPSAPGNFTVAHGLGVIPTAAIIQMTSTGAIWFQSATMYDATNLYLVASDTGLTGVARVLA